MIIEILADGGSSVGQVFKTLWDDALGALLAILGKRKLSTAPRSPGRFWQGWLGPLLVSCPFVPPSYC